MKVLITGTAGFIGYHLAERLLKRGDEVVGLDNINDYYDPEVKYSRLKNHGIDKEVIEWDTMVQSTTLPGYRFIRMNMEDREKMEKLFEEEKFDSIRMPTYRVIS
jgi:UDP-glucuronate 4-epimerase